MKNQKGNLIIELLIVFAIMVFSVFCLLKVVDSLKEEKTKSLNDEYQQLITNQKIVENLNLAIKDKVDCRYIAYSKSCKILDEELEKYNKTADYIVSANYLINRYYKESYSNKFESK